MGGGKIFTAVETADLTRAFMSASDNPQTGIEKKSDG